jgi:hypothetical protein
MSNIEQTENGQADKLFCCPLESHRCVSTDYYPFFGNCLTRRNWWPERLNELDAVI